MARAALILTAMAFLWAGCAGSPLDVDYREKVASETVSASVAGTFSVSFQNRDPSKEGLTK